MPDPPGDRRPIAARRWHASQRAAGWLARRGVSPNAISVAGMGCGVVAGGALAATAVWPGWASVSWAPAAVLIILRLTANMLDGMVAVEAGRASRLGEVFNDVPDRVSDSAILIGLGYAAGSDPVLGDLAALLAVLTAYVRVMGKVAGAPQFYQGPMAKTHRMWLVVAVCGFGAAAPGSLPVSARAGGLPVPALVLLVIVLGCVVTVARRLVLIRTALREPGA